MNNKAELYYKSFIRAVKDCTNDGSNREALKKIAFYGVKYINEDESQLQGVEEITNRFDLVQIISRLVGELTVNEFMNVFPISKDYDGDRFGVKDYFHTIDLVKELEKNKPIYKLNMTSVTHFLMEYWNKDIHLFMTRYTLLISALRQADGHISVMEEFLASQGMETPNTFKNSKGKPMYVRNGKPKAVLMTNGKHLKLVD